MDGRTYEAWRETLRRNGPEGCAAVPAPLPHDAISDRIHPEDGILGKLAQQPSRNQPNETLNRRWDRSSTLVVAVR